MKKLINSEIVCPFCWFSPDWNDERQMMGFPEFVSFASDIPTKEIVCGRCKKKFMVKREVKEKFITWSDEIE